MKYHLTALLFFLFTLACSTEEPDENGFFVQITAARVGATAIANETPKPIDAPILLSFSDQLLPDEVDNAVQLKSQNENYSLDFSYLDDNKTISLQPVTPLRYNTEYTLTIQSMKTVNGNFDGVVLTFSTEKGSLNVISIHIDGVPVGAGTNRITDVSLTPDIKISFDASVDIQSAANDIQMFQNGQIPLDYRLEDGDSTLIISPRQELSDFQRHRLLIYPDRLVNDEFEFDGLDLAFYTKINPVPKFPEISDEELLTRIQEQTFKYFWDFAHPVSGLARERNTSGETVTMGGSGFGLMAIIVGIERGFITRDEGILRFEKIIDFLANKADRFHGVWPHWMNGSTGKVIPFSTNDDGADLVETSFLVQGLITVRQYLDDADTREAALINTINEMCAGVEWDWHTKNGAENVLYWHWSPRVEWQMNLPVRGWNECLITYILAAASDTFNISKAVYDEGWARGGNIVNSGNMYYGIQLPLRNDRGGPLFFAHYSFLGLDPRNLEDQYADYWEQNRNHTLINRAYCIDNPLNYVGYSQDMWGLTASDGNAGYSAHSPDNDRGVITPTAAISSLPYAPEECLAAIRFLYYRLGDRLWGEYGFYDAFNVMEGWYATSYIAIDQGPIIIMIENYRTGLLWQLFMSAPEVQAGLDKLGFNY